jgi:dTDP-4-dehydrorhamnose 3,5-epimerase
MKVTPSAIPEVLAIEPDVFSDARGFLFESFSRRAFRDVAGLDLEFVQENQSRSHRGVLRGLHYQIRQSQGKLVRVVRGAVFDVAVDLRRSSPTFKQWVGEVLTEEDYKQLWIPPGFAHGFLVLSEEADVLYMATDYYAPEHERCVAWNDADIGVRWPLDVEPQLSARDRVGTPLAQAETFS